MFYYFQISLVDVVLKLPMYEPANPPTITIRIHKGICGERVIPDCVRPIRPDAEFRKMNAAETAAVSLLFAQ